MNNEREKLPFYLFGIFTGIIFAGVLYVVGKKSSLLDILQELVD